MKLDALQLAVTSYVGAIASAGGVQIAANAPADIFVPSLGGAMLSALFTLAPVIDAENDQPPRALAFKGFLTLCAGFLFGFYCSEVINTATIQGMGPLDWPPVTVAFLCAVFGERIISFGLQSKPADWWRWITSLRPGGGK